MSLRDIGSDHVFSAADASARGGGAGGGAPLTVLCTAFHAEDPWVIFGGTSTGAVVAWDMRRPGAPVARLAGLHAGPVLSLAVGGSAATGFELLSAGDDGTARRSALRASAHSGARGGAADAAGSVFALAAGSERGGGAAAAVDADAPLAATAWLTSSAQRTAGRGEGVVVAASASGALEWAVAYR
jgi:hypothetical protein